MTAPKPAILFVSGAWHTPTHYASFKEKLEDQGYEVFVPQLPTCGGKTGTTWKDDVPFLHSIVEPHMDQGKEFIVVCHSYGGIPGCTATKGYTVEERQQAGKKGGFRSILFVAAFAVPQPGLDVLQCIGGKYAPWMAPQPAYQGNQLCYVNEQAKHAFYNDLPEDQVQKCFDALLPHSQDALETPVEFLTSELTIPKTFLICEIDQAMPVEVQRMLASATPGMKVETCSAGHTPFLSQPGRVIEVINSL